MAISEPRWVVPVMRAGYVGRTAVYLTVGWLALAAAWGGGSAEGTTGALEQLRGEWWGAPALALIAAGLLAYALWRFLDAILDLDDHSHDGKGLASRSGMLISAVIHVSLAISAASLAIGSGSGASGGGSESLVAKLMDQGWGRWLVGAVGIGVVGAGFYQFYKAINESYREHLRDTRLVERLSAVLRAGVFAHGLVIAIIGGFLIWAAATYDASKAGGLDQALSTLRSAPFGRVLLAVVALGLLSFAVFCAVNARYRVIPMNDRAEVATLANKLKP